jgi:hypothetical protein
LRARTVALLNASPRNATRSLTLAFQDRHVEETIATVGDYRVAKAAFDRAVRERPGRIITLRQKAQLIADSRRKN